MVSMWTPHGFYMDSMWLLCGHNIVTTWTPHGSQANTIWFPCGYNVHTISFPGGHHNVSNVDTI